MEVKSGRSNLIDPDFEAYQRKRRESLHQDLAKSASQPVDPVLSASPLFAPEASVLLVDDDADISVIRNRILFSMGVAETTSTLLPLERRMANEVEEEGGPLGGDCFTSKTALPPPPPRTGEPLTELIIERILERAMSDSSHPLLRSRQTLALSDAALEVSSTSVLGKAV